MFVSVWVHWHYQSIDSKQKHTHTHHGHPWGFIVTSLDVQRLSFRKKSIDGVTVSHVSCLLNLIHFQSLQSWDECPSTQMSYVWIIAFDHIFTCKYPLHSPKLGNQLASCLGWGFPWISHGFAGTPWAQQAGATAAGGTGSRYNERGAALCTASGERWPTCYHLIFQVWNTHGDHTHTRAYHILYVYTFV